MRIRAMNMYNIFFSRLMRLLLVPVDNVATGVACHDENIIRMYVYVYMHRYMYLRQNSKTEREAENPVAANQGLVIAPTPFVPCISSESWL